MAQRFLWRSGNDKICPDVYEMLVLRFFVAYLVVTTFKKRATKYSYVGI